jgi:hypothetical protein
MPIVALNLDRCSIDDLTPLRGMPLKSLQARCEMLSNLGPLAGMKLETLDLDGAAVEDLTPLKGMPLRTLNANNCKKLHDLSPLGGMSLTTILLPPDARQIEVLRDMKTLGSINGLPPAQFWKLWDAAKTKKK